MATGHWPPRLRPWLTGTPPQSTHPTRPLFGATFLLGCRYQPNLKNSRCRPSHTHVASSNLSESRLLRCRQSTETSPLHPPQHSERNRLDHHVQQSRCHWYVPSQFSRPRSCLGTGQTTYIKADCPCCLSCYYPGSLESKSLRVALIEQSGMRDDFPDPEEPYMPYSSAPFDRLALLLRLHCLK
jgi:hypothetical protein